MKLLFILGNVINRAGVERIMIQKINYLAESNCEVSLITTEQNNQPISFPLSSNVKYISVNAPIPSKTNYSFFKWLIYFHKARIEFEKGIYRVIKEECPDILLCTTYSFDVLDLLTKICHKNLHLFIFAFRAFAQSQFLSNFMIHLKINQM